MKIQPSLMAVIASAITLAADPVSAQLFFSTQLNTIIGASGVQGAVFPPSYNSSSVGAISDFAFSAAGLSVATANYNRLTVATSAGYYHNSVAQASTRDIFTIEKSGFGSGFITLEFQLLGNAPTDLRDGDGGQAIWDMRYYQDGEFGIGLNQSKTVGWAISSNNNACYTNFCSQSGPIFGGNGDAEVVNDMFGYFSYRVPVDEGRAIHLLNQISCGAGVRSDRVSPFTCNLNLRFLGISKFETADGNAITDYTISSLSGFQYSNGTSNVPEPQTWINLIVGFGTLGMLARARRKRGESLSSTQ